MRLDEVVGLDDAQMAVQVDRDGLRPRRLAAHVLAAGGRAVGIERNDGFGHLQLPLFLMVAPGGAPRRVGWRVLLACRLKNCE
jgi:hypothetical protein